MPKSTARVGASTASFACATVIDPVARKATAPSRTNPVRSIARPGIRPTARPA